MAKVLEYDRRKAVAYAQVGFAGTLRIMILKISEEIVPILLRRWFMREAES